MNEHEMQTKILMNTVGEEKVEKLLDVLEDIRDESAKTNDALEKLGKTVDEVGNSQRRKSLLSLSTSFKKYATILFKTTNEVDKMVASQNVLTQTFGSGTEKLNDYISNLARMTGISTADIANKSALFSQMATSLGMSAEMAEEFTIKLDDLSAKLALLYGKDFPSMAKAMLDAVKGESSTLASLTGNVLKGTGALQNTLDSLGIDMKTNELNGVNKAMLEYITIARQLNVSVQDEENQLSDLGRIVNDVAWQKQILSNQVKELARAFGNLLYPVLRAILPVINAILMVITDLISILAGFFGGDEITSNVSGMAQSFGDLASNITEANNASKKLRGFDKLNNITTPSSNNISNLGGGVDPRIYEEYAKISEEMLKISNRAREIADNVMKWLGFTKEDGEWTWKLSNILDQIKEKGPDLLKFIGIISGIALAVGLVTVGIKKLFEKLKGGSGSTNGISKLFSKMGDGIKALSVGLAGLMLLGGVAIVINSLSEFVKTVAESGKETSDILLLIGGALLEVAIAMGIFVVLAKSMKALDLVGFTIMMAGMVGILYELKELIKTINDSGTDMETIIIGLLGVFADLIVLMGAIVVLAMILATNPLALLGVVAVVGALVLILYALRDTLPTILDAVGDFIVKTAPSAIKMIDTICTHIERVIFLLGVTLPNIINSLGRVFNIIFNGISNIVDTVGNTIVDILDAIGRLVDKVLKSILDFVNGAGPAINNFIDGIIQAVTKLINFMVSGIEYLINTLIVDSVNSMIRSIAGTTIGKALSKIGVLNTSDIPSVSIRRFNPQLYANGGFPEDGLFMANHNELVGKFSNGKTAVANNEQIVKGIENGVANGMAKALASTNVSDNRPIYVKAQFGSDEVTDWVQVQNRKRERQYGF